MKSIRPFLLSPAIHLFIILCLGSSLFFVRLGARPLADSEGRWGEIAREMLITGNWIIPKINGIPYRDKPVGSYWLVALASLPGHHVTETTARIPSALAMLFGALFLYGIARHFWDNLTSLLASLFFLTSYPIIFWGRKANGDTLTLLGMLVCVWIFLKAREKVEYDFRWLYPYFVIAGVTSLMKGLLGFVLPSLIVFSYLLIKKPRQVFRKRFFFHCLCAFILGLVLFLIPIFLDILITHTDSSLYLVYRENILRFFHPFDHRAPFYYYFGYIFITVGPWSLFSLFLIFTLIKRKQFRDEGVLFFGLWFIVLFTFFNLAGSKRGYYLVPIIPAFAALLAHIFRQVENVKPLFKPERIFLLFPAALVLGVGFLIIFLPFAPFSKLFPKGLLGEIRLELFLSGIILLLAATLACWLMLKGRMMGGLFALMGGIYVVFCMGFWFVAPVIAKRNAMKPFCKKVISCTKGAEVGIYGLADRSTLYFYLDGQRNLPHLATLQEARCFFQKFPRGYLIVNGWGDLRTLKPEKIKVIISGNIKGKRVYFLVKRQKRR